MMSMGVYKIWYTGLYKIWCPAELGDKMRHFSKHFPEKGNLILPTLSQLSLLTLQLSVTAETLAALCASIVFCFLVCFFGSPAWPQDWDPLALPSPEGLTNLAIIQWWWNRKTSTKNWVIIPYCYRQGSLGALLYIREGIQDTYSL